MTTVMATRGRHGWQRPLHPLQMVGMTVFSFSAVPFYIFLGLLLGSGATEITVTTIFSFVVFSAMFLFVWCTAIIRWIRPIIERRREAPKRWRLWTFVPIPRARPSNFNA